MTAVPRIDHNNNFDLIRLLAACQVVYVHAHGHLELPIGYEKHLAYLFLGVPVFFVVSGFLVTDSWLRSPSVGAFFWNRSVRIYPGLAANIVGMEFLYWLGGAVLWGAGIGFFGIMAVYIATASLSLGYYLFPVSTSLHYGHTFFGKPPPTGVLWTLSVELSFYALLPLVLAPLRWGRAAGVAFALAVTIASYWLATYVTRPFLKENLWLLYTVPVFFWIFSIGILTRLLWDRVAPLLTGKGLWWLAAYGVSEYILQTYFHDSASLSWKGGVTPVSIFRASMMGMTVISVAFTAPRLGRYIRYDLSYGLYLWHMTVIASLVALGYTRSLWLWPVVFAGGFALAAISCFLIERPALRFKKRRTRASEGTLPAALPASS